MTTAVKAPRYNLDTSVIPKDKKTSKRDKQANAFASQKEFGVAARIRGCEPMMRCKNTIACPDCAKNAAIVQTVIIERIYDQKSLEEQDHIIKDELHLEVRRLLKGLAEIQSMLEEGHENKGDPYWGKTTDRFKKVMRLLPALKNRSKTYDEVGHKGVGKRIRWAFEDLTRALKEGSARYNHSQRKIYIELIEDIRRHINSPFDTGWQLITLKMNKTGLPGDKLGKIKAGTKKLSSLLKGPTSGIVFYFDRTPGRGFDHLHAWYRGPRLTKSELLELWKRSTQDEQVEVWIKDKPKGEGVGAYSCYSMDSHSKKYPFSAEERVEAHLVKGRKHLVGWYGCLKAKKTKVLAEQKQVVNRKKNLQLGGNSGYCHPESLRIAS